MLCSPSFIDELFYFLRNMKEKREREAVEWWWKGRRGSERKLSFITTCESLPLLFMSKSANAWSNEASGIEDGMGWDGIGWDGVSQSRSGAAVKPRHTFRSGAMSKVSSTRPLQVSTESTNSCRPMPFFPTCKRRMTWLLNCRCLRSCCRSIRSSDSFS